LQGGFNRQLQHQAEKQAAPERAVGHEPLRILQVGPFDPGAVIYRLHTGINTTSPNTSVMSTAHQEWFKSPYQFDHGADDFEQVAHMRPDIAHYHVQYNGAPPIDSRWTIIHHHGSVYRWNPERCNELDQERADIRLVSNPELLQYGDNLYYLPNPVPVGDYQRLARNRPTWRHGLLVVAHSPTKRENKATDAFLKAVDRCRAKGLDVRASIAHGVSHKATLEIKARSHAVFDSFWLGMQCSGLEGAAMGLPVLAGDEDVRAYQLSTRERVPWTYANDVDALTEQLERLATDRDYYEQESAEVLGYVMDRHDTPNVVAEYLELLDTRLDWRNTLAMGTP
jgi:hypothetical protein